MAEAIVTPQQFWIRNEEGKVWGPLAASSLELLVPQGVFPGKLQASTDGLSFAMVGRFAELREVLEQDLWGIDPSEIPADDPVSQVETGPVSPADVAPSPVAPPPKSRQLLHEKG